MSDLISRSKLQQAIKRSPAIMDKGKHYVRLDAVLGKLLVAPTIDAVPVVHARWVKDVERNTYCSHCEKYIPAVHCYQEYQDYDSEWDEEIEETEFCPHCGAKMDEEE